MERKGNVNLEIGRNQNKNTVRFEEEQNILRSDRIKTSNRVEKLGAMEYSILELDRLEKEPKTQSQVIRITRRSTFMARDTYVVQHLEKDKTVFHNQRRGECRIENLAC